MEFLQEVQETTLLELYNQKRISVWVGYNIHLPSLQLQSYTKWELQIPF